MSNYFELLEKIVLSILIICTIIAIGMGVLVTNRRQLIR